MSPVVAFTAGSLGDILAVAGLAARVAKVFYDNRHVTQECESIASEMKHLQQVLILADSAWKQYETTPLGIPLLHFIRPEIVECRNILQKCLDDLVANKNVMASAGARSLWTRFVWVATNQSTALRERLSKHRMNLTFQLLCLSRCVSVFLSLGLCQHFRSLGLLEVHDNSIKTFQAGEAMRQANISLRKRVEIAVIIVIDQLGEPLPIPSNLCETWDVSSSTMADTLVE